MPSLLSFSGTGQLSFVTKVLDEIWLPNLGGTLGVVSYLR